MTSQTYFDTFLGMLQRMATVDQELGALRLSALEGVRLDPPVELVIDQA